MYKFDLPRTFAFAATGLCCAVLLHPAATARAAAADAGKVEFPAPSAHGVVKQRIGVTDVEIDYSRPNKNGREIFGGLVPWNAVWRTGANGSTKITLSDTVNVGGKEIPAGKYGLYTIPAANGEWTVIIYKDPNQWGSYEYKQADDLARASAKAETLTKPVETFTIGFADVKETSATLCLEWDRTRVTVPLMVDTVAKVKAGIARTIAAPGVTPQFYAQAANYYLSHNFDLPKALEWINLAMADPAIQKAPGFWGYYQRKASIQGKLGDKPGALASAEKALELAKANPTEASPEDIEGLTKLANSFR